MMMLMMSVVDLMTCEVQKGKACAILGTARENN
jgi:hypothetical protein